MLGTLELPKGRLELGGVQGPRAGDRARRRQSVGGGRALRGTRQARHAEALTGPCTGLHEPIVVAAAHELKN